MKRYLLGIDVGTTGTKTILFSEDGELIGQAYRGYPLRTPCVGFSEQLAEDWWNAVVETVREVCADGDIAKQVLAISLSTQGGTVVPTDEEGHELCPAIVWNDARCEEQKRAFEQEVGGDELMYTTTGWHLTHKLPAMVIRWLKDNRREMFEKAKMFLSVPDYLSMKMTGNPVVDISNAGINQLCNITTQSYDERLLRFAGINECQLAHIFPSSKKIGHLTKEAADALGLSVQTVLVSGAHDQYAVALGAGATKAADILIGSGTCWVITAMANAPDFTSGLSQSRSAVPGKWGVLRSLSSGGVCLDWLRKQIASEEMMQFAMLDQEAAKRKAAEEGLFFYPFAGKASNEKMLCRGSFVGMDLSHDRFHFARAIMEGVVFQILWMMEEFQEKPSDSGIILSGGASKSDFWSQLLADVSGLCVRIPATADLACVGAAVIAGVGCGLYANVEEGYRRLAVGERILQPNTEKTKLYEPIFASYKQKASALI